MSADLETLLADMKVPELKAKAKELGIDGADGMKKAELIETILAKSGPEIVQASDAGDGDSSPIKPQAAATYRDHQGDWESKKEIAQRSRELHSRQEYVDLAKHTKFDKFKSHGGK